MKIIILSLLALTPTAFAAERMDCNFGFSGVAILISQTQLLAEDKVGEFSKVNFQGSPPKTIPNLAQPLALNEKMKFQLDEGFGENNIVITVSQQRVGENTFAAIVENPQTPTFKRMQGTCQIF